MTLAALTRRVTFWQNTLKPLGLAHWDIEVEITDDDDTTKAHVQASTHYDKAWMTFQQRFVEGDEADDLDEIDQTIIHELVHIAMRDLDGEITKMEEFVGVIGKEVWSTGVNHAREGLVDRVARTLYLTYTLTPSRNVVRSKR